jgi:hypothetical protein
MTARFQPRPTSRDVGPSEETTFQLVQDIVNTPEAMNRWNVPTDNKPEETLTYVSSDGSSREKSKPCVDNVCAKPNRFFSRFAPSSGKFEPRTPSSTPVERKSRFEPVPVLSSYNPPRVDPLPEDWTSAMANPDRVPETHPVNPPRQHIPIPESEKTVFSLPENPAPKIIHRPADIPRVVKPTETEIKPEEVESKRRPTVSSYEKPRVDPDLSQMLNKVIASPWLQEEPYKSTLVRLLYAFQDRPFPREWTPYFVNDLYITSDAVAKFEGSEFIFQVGLAGIIPSGTSPLIYPFGATPVDVVGSYPDQDITLIYAQPNNPMAQLKTRLMRHGFQYVLVPNVSHNFNDIQLPTIFTFRGQLKAR